MNIQWDAGKYTDQFSFVHQYGSALIDMVEGEGLSVLDLGCDNGALTKELAGCHPVDTEMKVVSGEIEATTGLIWYG